MKVAHIYASTAKNNSGDFMIGISTKKYFKEKIINYEGKIDFFDLNCRDKNLFNNDNIDKLNQFDHIIVGSGGLILPDTCPNKISCWQWIISKENINKITKPIYVISIGWNLFYNQTINMMNKNNNIEDKSRTNIFKDNISALIEKSVHFTLRHKMDVKSLINIVGDKYSEKVLYEMCPTVWYVKKYWKPKMKNVKEKYYAIEIKDDRQWRRYHKIGIKKYYDYLLTIVKNHIQNNEKILYLSHDGASSFYRYLIQNNVKIPYLANNCANEEKIMNNYSFIHTIYCSAGHSQMMSYGLDIKIKSLISHPKLKNFCDDINDHEGALEVNKLL